MLVNRYMQKHLGKEGYFMRIRIFPYQVLRENKQAQGAGADRVSQGMSHSFGKVIGRAARTKNGQAVISVLVDEENIEVAKEALMRTKAKLPFKLTVKVHTDVESIGTRPRAVKIKMAEEKAEKEEKAEEKKEVEEEVEGEEKEGEEKGKGEAKEGEEKGKGEAKEGEKKEGKEEKKEEKGEKKGEAKGKK